MRPAGSRPDGSAQAEEGQDGDDDDDQSDEIDDAVHGEPSGFCGRDPTGVAQCHESGFAPSNVRPTGTVPLKPPVRAGSRHEISLQGLDRATAQRIVPTSE